MDEFPRHVLIPNDRESGLVHVPTKGDITENSRQEFALERTMVPDYGYSSIEGCDVFHIIAFHIKGR